MKKLISLFALGLALLTGAAHANDAETLVRNTSNDVLELMKKEKNDKKLREQIEQRTLPYFDFTRMTGLAVGLPWRSATDAQKSQLTDEFKTLLIRTYSSTLTSYKVQGIEVKPVKAEANSTDVTVLTDVSVSGQQPVAINYKLRKVDQNWRVYDVVVGGVSLVTNYRGSFGDTIKQSGVDGLIKSLKDKNTTNTGK
ncbi:phospholipid transport system substrate-binding protein [Chitinivorax tropicus]|uniref:Phospholipid transport system substrate-binding protein n=1 Tax=Chitinivorax tropicus TaxID=714531 RepID=A0A840MPW0_9PROT|nr:ABC transporter substrate-binding protein [Chitinivorax tropicus]MBB5019485.1 phospholipid transport system substrate-binding protein [Chitinivorax tropicus]